MAASRSRNEAVIGNCETAERNDAEVAQVAVDGDECPSATESTR